MAPAEDGRGVRLSRLAAWSIACSAALCCPLTSFLGVILGFRALRAIRASDGRLRGQGMAASAILIGLLSIVGQMVAANIYSGRSIEFLEQETGDLVRSVFADGVDDSDAGARDIWVREAARRIAQDRADDGFVQECTTRFGAFRRVALQLPFDQESGWSMHMRVPATFEFENATKLGAVRILVSPRGVNPLGDVRLVEIRIGDSERGDLVLPPES